MSSLSFLVVDDASFIRDLVKRTLRQQFAQCQIDEAVNGKKAQSLLSKKQYDLVLCDWEMPEQSGIEVLQWLRAYENDNGLPKTPFMMVTSRGDKTNVVEAVQAGVSDYIGKPFSNDQILKKVLKLLSVNHGALVKSILKGAAAMKPTFGSANESAGVLLGAAPQAAKKPASSNSAGSASLLTTGAPSSKLVDKEPIRAGKTKPKASILAKVAVRSPKAAWQGDLRDINLTDLSMTVELDDTVPPTVLDQVVVDIVPKNDPDAVARINTMVTSVALTEKSLSCSRLNLNVRIVDDDQEKLETLSKFIAQVRR
ncbi:response regulator [Reinekea marina]|uniref:Response regulator n=1 Tax=Reinekea marina TaxID=1310421 RepID=A0ABV7WS45_9GAMM|nr:response regulator [Reinekea marina]MDN3650927.1 response regulator [Reinekea marina]